ncbi:MAG: toll/interleukin-1 receptor domain-containing protein [Hyphomonadaceae bacterium]|nr:toll/interleukin-1 receptor domain-containing protein [Hyphomonadaceae bacterium]
MADIFVSYKSERRPAARHLAKVLGAYGYKVWYDYGLIPGENFERRLHTEMAEAQIILVLWCSMAKASDWVNREAKEAVQTGKYLPCRIESTDLPDDFALADTINLIDWDGAPRSHVLDRLLGDVARRLERDPTMDFNRLRELDEDWRGYGAPSLSQFALGEALTPGATLESRNERQTAGALPQQPPSGLSQNLKNHWRNAIDGDPVALYQIAWHYEFGRGGLPQNDREAVRLYELAANQGNVSATANLGFMYACGRGGAPKDDKEAVRLYKLAADQGNAGAQANLAIMHRDGRGGLDQNENEAVRLFKLAADQGNTFAQSDLGFMYERGRGGLAKDETQAAQLYKLAAQQGNAGARANLAAMYRDGRGSLQKDVEEAVRLYTLAAEQGNMYAQADLGYLYESGRGGVLIDRKKAARLYKLAADQGNRWAQERLSELEP